jgi:hypothetical protein
MTATSNMAATLWPTTFVVKIRLMVG